MPFYEKPLRYAHSEGYTTVCYSDDGSYIITCGNEGDVRIWNGFNDEEPIEKCVGDKAYAVVVKGENMYVGTSNNYVQSFTFPEAELDRVVTRFKAPVTSVDVSPDGKILVCGSQDMEIHITEDGKLSNVLTDHSAPVLSVAIDPKGEYFASSSCDGTVRVWKLNGEQKEIVSKWECIPKSSSVETSKTRCKISWTPTTGNFLAVPQKGEVGLYTRQEWRKTISLTAASVDETQFFSVCNISHCGKYLAASTSDTNIYIWNILKRALDFKITTKISVCAIAWKPDSRPNDYEFVFCNTDGYLGQVEYQPSESVSILGSKDENFADELSNFAFEANDDAEDENAVSLEKIRAELGFNPDGTQIENRGRSRSKSRSRSRSRSGSRSSIRSRSPRRVVPQIEMQQPFQPTSTPTILEYRFMAWNDVGIIEQTNTEDVQAISVKFHDSSFHHPLRIQNDLNYSLGVLSCEALVFASEKVDNKPSYFYCSPFRNGLEWFTELPADEEAVAVSAGSGWVAVASDLQNLRIFSVGGNQREVISVPGPVVCLSGHEDLLAVTFHVSTGFGGHQWLGYMIVEIKPANICKVLIQSQSLPLTPGSTLKWLGFSDCGALCTTDSLGCVRLLSSSRGWHLIGNTKKQVINKSDNYFVIGVDECQQTIKVLLCKGSDYPSVIPTPYMTEISWKLPLCGSMQAEDGKSALEEQLWKTKLASHCMEFTGNSDDNTKVFDAQKKASVILNSTAMKLISLACSADHNSRAVELCQLAGSTLLMELAMQYAHGLNKVTLAEKISDILVDKRMENENKISRTSSNMYSNDVSCRRIETVFTTVNSNNVEDKNRYWNGNSRDVDCNNASQDIFACLSDNKAGPSNSNVQKKHLSPYAGRHSASKEDVSLIRKRAVNPFKKAQNNVSESSSPISSTPLVKTSTISGVLNKKAKSIKEKLNTSLVGADPQKSSVPPFKDWFNSEKENFQKENPNLSIAQITKLALKQYKELKSAGGLVSNSSFDSNTSIRSDVANENYSEEMFVESPTLDTSSVNRKRKHEENEKENDKETSLNSEEVNDETNGDTHPKKISNSNQKTLDDSLKNGSVKSASKLSGFFFKK